MCVRTYQRKKRRRKNKRRERNGEELEERLPSEELGRPLYGFVLLSLRLRPSLLVLSTDTEKHNTHRAGDPVPAERHTDMYICLPVYPSTSGALHVYMYRWRCLYGSTGCMSTRADGGGALGFHGTPEAFADVQTRTYADADRLMPFSSPVRVDRQRRI